MPKAAVLPVPVRAWPSMSTPARARGISRSWISEGVTNFSFGECAEDGRSDAEGGERFGDGGVVGFVAQRIAACFLKVLAFRGIVR